MWVFFGTVYIKAVKKRAINGTGSTVGGIFTGVLSRDDFITI